MSITALLNRACNQDAVYWGNPVNGGFGTFTFDAAVDIKVRWHSSVEVFKDASGREVPSTAVIHLLQDVDEQGWLYLGSLDDFSSTPTNPKEVAGAYEILRFEKIPSLDGTQFVRKAYL